MVTRESSARSPDVRDVWARWRGYATLFVALALFVQVAHAQLRVGDPAPRLDAVLLDGATLRADALDGKVVVQMFWATWCPFCVAEMPHIQKLHEAYASRGLVIVAVSLDRGRDEVVRFWSEHRYVFLVAMRSQEMREGWGSIRGTPTFYVVDRQGVVRLAHTGTPPEGELEALIKKLL
ncbi:MAG: TlpA family protein disulfide reductase [Burkholderiaceae bacterium]|nr:TlpA family protein disulfide reductase [Burkholderiaceae bacterium]